MANIFEQMKSGTEYLNYGRDIISNAALQYAKEHNKSTLNIVDLGAGFGDDLINCRNVIEQAGGVSIKLYAIENYKPNADKLEKIGIKTFTSNVETDRYPFEDAQFDIVIMNQLLEHTKEVFHIFGEISRILKKGGICIVGVPNLASFHNRILLLFGRQPSAIHMFGPHVRGITRKDFINFAEKDGFFKCEKSYGSNFYPFHPPVSEWLSRAFPYASVSIFFVLRRTEKEGNYSDILDKVFFETPYRK